MTASAVLRVGSHAPVPLYGTPAVAAGCRPGEVTIILGYTASGEPVTTTISTLEWTRDLFAAGLEAEARGAVRAGMTRTAVTA